MSGSTRPSFFSVSYAVYQCRTKLFLPTRECTKAHLAGRKIFFGAMVAEGIVASIWAAAVICFLGGMENFQNYMADNGNSAAVVVKNIS